MKTVYLLLTFGVSFTKEAIYAGEPVVNKIVNGVLSEVYMLDDLEIPDLEGKLESSKLCSKSEYCYLVDEHGELCKTI